MGLHLQLSLLVGVGWMYDREGSWRWPEVHGYKGGVCGILSPIWPELTLFTIPHIISSDCEYDTDVLAPLKQWSISNDIV